MIVLKEFEFDAAHYLPSYNGKCEHLHGHTYKLVVKVDGRPDMEGMVLDFSLLKKIVQIPARKTLQSGFGISWPNRYMRKTGGCMKWKYGKPGPAAAYTAENFTKVNYVK